MSCSCPHAVLCVECWQGYALYVGDTCPCCLRKGKRPDDPMSIENRLARGEKCRRCGVVTHRPWKIYAEGGFRCYGCKLRR